MITIKNINYHDICTIENKFDSLGYNLGIDYYFLFSRYMLPNNRYEAMTIIMKNSKLLADKRLKENLLEYLI